jgi:hypothetical protein
MVAAGVSANHQFPNRGFSVVQGKAARTSLWVELIRSPSGRRMTGICALLSFTALSSNGRNPPIADGQAPRRGNRDTDGDQWWGLPLILLLGWLIGALAK